MANSLKSPYTSTSTSTVDLVPYRDELPMTTPKLDDSTSPEPRSAGLMSDADAARPPLVPPHLRFRSTVPLLPTPGTVSKRNPPYVRRRSIFLTMDVNSLHLCVGTLRTPLLDRGPWRCVARPHRGCTRGRTSNIERQ